MTVPGEFDRGFGVFRRIGRFCYRRRRLVLALWALVAVAGIASAPLTVSRLTDSHGPAGSESARAWRVLDTAAPVGERLVGLIDGAAVDDPTLAAAVQAAAARVSAVPGVHAVTDYYATHDPRLRSRDGQASLMVVEIARNASHATTEKVLSQVRKALAPIPAHVAVGGEVAYWSDLNSGTSKDIARAETVTLPIVLVSLVVVFGGFIAATLPVIGALAAMTTCFLVLLLATFVLDLSSYTLSVTSMLGLGLSVDYSLLMVQRFREELASGRSAADAVERTVASAGRTVTFSGLTVIACLAALVAFNEPTYRSLAIGGMAVVLVAMFAGATLIPALLGAAAKRVRPQPPNVSDDGRFARLGAWVQHRPVLVVVAVGGLLLASAAPFLGVHFHSRDNREIPRGSGSRIVADALESRFTGASSADPITVVLPEAFTDVRVTSYVTQVQSWPGVATVTVERGLSGPWSAIDVQPTGATEGPVARGLVRELRAHRPPGGSLVTGDAAYTADSLARVRTDLPLALGIIVLAAFVLMFLLTGSLVVPVKALLLSTLSLGATFGTLKLIFQDGHLSSLLGFDPSGALDTDIPVVVFVFAFALSMDYEIFLLARIKEAYDHGADNDTAVRLGLQRSGRIVTCAAALITLVFAGFAAGHTVPTKEIGFGLAMAVLVDATLVRCLLLPATMTLLGHRNWWAPRPLRAFALTHHLGEEELEHAEADGQSPIAVAAGTAR